MKTIVFLLLKLAVPRGQSDLCQQKMDPAVGMLHEKMFRVGLTWAQKKAGKKMIVELSADQVPVHLRREGRSVC